MSNPITKMAASICLSVLATLAASTAEAAEDGWQFGASIYGWFPDISGKTAFSDETDDGEFEIDVKDILENLEFTLQGGFDARKGRWGVATDLIYMSVGNSQRSSQEGTLGGTQIPVDASARVELDMKSWIWTTAGYYRFVDADNHSFDLLAGFRYIDVEQKLDWSFSGNIGDIPLPGREGSGKAKLSNWDFVVGLRGRYGFGSSAWYIPYYLDIGTGDSDFTWQAAAGLGYAFNWGEIVGVWRVLDYELDSGSAIAEMEFSGPAIGATFRW
jgi:hypothetical protein